MADPIRFGTDGWRGIIADEFTFANLRLIVEATARYMRRRPMILHDAILVGYDRRFLSRRFAECASAQLASRGLPVKLASTPLPTPALSAAVVARKAPWGLMITASHNPAIYNGFKIKDRYGRSAPTAVTDGIEKELRRLGKPAQLAHGRSARQPAAKPIPCFDWRPDYQRYIQRLLDLKKLKAFHARVAFDCLYGATAGLPEMLLKGSRINLYSLHPEADPMFGGLHPEPIEPNLKPLMSEVRRLGAHAGFACDGDGDRLGVVDERGRYLTPHQVFPLLLLYLIEHKGLKGKVVQSVSLGALGERIAQTYNLDFEEVPVGFKYVAERMLTQDILAGGEESGGYAFRGGLPERDGILSALMFLELMAAARQTPSQLLQAMEKRFGPARFKRCDIPLRRPVEDKGRFTARIAARLPERLAVGRVVQVRQQDGIKIVLQDGAWLLMRPSGTEPLLRTYAESGAQGRTNRLLALARQWSQEALC